MIEHQPDRQPTGPARSPSFPFPAMSAIALIVVPVFALIAVGYLAARFGAISGEAIRGLSQFVFNFAMPALLFRTAAAVDLGSMHPWGVWGAYFGGAAVVIALAVLISRRVPALSAAGGSAAGITASFGNLVMMGLPLSLAGFGEEGIVPAAVLVSVHAPVQWLVATLIAQWADRGPGRPMGEVMWQFLMGLLRNPIIAALLGGLLWGALGRPIPEIVDRPLELLGQAGTPTALFALGASLAAHGLRGQLGAVAIVMALKMLLFPVLAWLLATQVFALGPVQTGIVVLFAGLPAGANAYIFSEQHRAAVPVASGAIVLGTALSIVTISVTLLLLGPA